MVNTSAEEQKTIDSVSFGIRGDSLLRLLATLAVGGIVFLAATGIVYGLLSDARKTEFGAGPALCYADPVAIYPRLRSLADKLVFVDGDTQRRNGSVAVSSCGKRLTVVPGSEMGLATSVCVILLSVIRYTGFLPRFSSADIPLGIYIVD